MYHEAIDLLLNEAAKQDTTDAVAADRLRRAVELLSFCEPKEGVVGDAGVAFAAINGATEFAFVRAGIVNYNLLSIKTESIGGEDGRLSEIIRGSFANGEQGEIHFISFSKQLSDLKSHSADTAVALSSRFNNLAFSIVAAVATDVALENSILSKTEHKGASESAPAEGQCAEQPAQGQCCGAH